MAKKAQTIASTETLEPRIYEIGYLLSPAVRDEDLSARVSDLKDSLINLGAEVIAEGAPEFIDLAYQMSRVIENKRIRFDQGYFGWVKISLNPAQMTALKELLEKNTLLIRYLLISATRENTIIGKKSLGKILKGERQEYDKEAMGEVPVAAEVTAEPEIPVEKIEEVLDAEIKELVKEA
jgi:ribosomal protein S6